MPKPKAAARAKTAPAAFPIVGIGASAGGLEALTRLLGELPADTGMAFVVVQHLDPERESLLPVILQKRTAMPVSQATDGMRVRPDHLYIIPPNVHMGIAKGRLTLGPRPRSLPPASVNCFLSSLARERGNKAVGVILSGTASDGALGVKAIKEEGGVVFAQDEASATHAGMPHSAMETGVVDFILPPERIAGELARIARHPVLSTRGAQDLFADAGSLGRVFAAVKRVTSVDFGLYKAATVRRRLVRRMLVHRLERLEAYADLVEKDAGEARALHDDLLINVTQFFREPRSIEVLRAKAFPRFLKGLPPGAPIRVWVPGCATGEEAYSLAVTLLDFLGERDAMNPVQVFATDISETALAVARAGVYPADIAADVPPRLLRRFFTKSDRGYEVAKRVRDLCVFARQDLTKDPPFANVDLISCCNVLIYLAPEAQKRILPMFHYALRPSGALLLSAAESVGEFGNLFAPMDRRCRLYAKKPAPRTHLSVSTRTYPGAPPPPPSRPPAPAWPETDVQKVAERILLGRYAPPGLIVDGDLEILHFRGRVNRFLEPATGRASLSLLKMLPAHAASQVKSLLARTRRSDAPVKAALELGEAPGTRVSVELIPFRLPTTGTRYFIVLFDEGPGAGARPGGRAARPAAAPREGAVLRRLQNELTSTRGYLQTLVEEHEAATEELRSANEEIVSSNEELQSTNEELEVAKEELQAANEELSTLNEELQTRNDDLGALNNDLTNLIASIHLPIVMVGADLRIRRFSPMAEKVMSLVPTDVGRPIGDIKLRIDLPNIEEIVADVIESVASKELDVRDKDGRLFLVRVRPYRTADNRIDGAVLVFSDNDPVLRPLSGLESASAFEAVLDLTPEPLAVLDGELRVQGGSRTLYQAYGLTKSQMGRSLFEIEGGRWDIPALRRALERLAAGGGTFSALEAAVAGRRLRFSARRVAPPGAAPFVLLAIEERPARD